MAWVGDAVLSLFARQWILEHGSAYCQPRHELLRHMTSNQFLSALDNPTSVEAVIGRLYQEKGWGAAEAWIRDNLLPVFLRQMANRRPH